MASRLYTAHSDRLGRPVTVTVYPALADDGARRRFDDAAVSAQRLAAHPSVLTIHDWGHGADGRPWVVTDPQPPETVDNVLRADGPLPVEQALQIGVLVAGALETAHRAGILHGDLSPARLVFGPQGEPLVADIGLAEFSDFPGFGALHNPIRYFAPPEVLERTGVSPASDVYSLATTVYALLAGSAPHEKPADMTDSNASLLLRILQIEVPPIVRPDEDIDGVELALGPALAHAADMRPRRVLDLALSLQDVQRNLALAVVEPVVLDLGNPERPNQPPPAAAAPVLPAAPVLAVEPDPPSPDSPPAWYTESVPNPAGTSGSDLVHLFSDTPPDFTDRSRGATAHHWATGLGHLGGPAPPAGYDDQAVEGPPRRPDEPSPPAPYQPDEPHQPDEPSPPAAATGAWAPTTGYRPNGHTPEPSTGVPPEAHNGRGNGLRPAPRTRAPVDADTMPTRPGSSPVPPIVPRGRAPSQQAPPGRSSGPRRRSVSGSEAQGSGAFPAAERTPSGSALERARQARMRVYVGSGTAEPEHGQRAAGRSRVPGPASPSNGAPALPVIVLIVVVVLLTVGVAYMVITGDDTSNPVDDQPGASAASAQPSFDQA